MRLIWSYALAVRLGVGADALFVDGVIGVSQEDVGETGLQEVHGEEGGLLHNLQRNHMSIAFGNTKIRSWARSAAVMLPGAKVQRSERIIHSFKRSGLCFSLFERSLLVWVTETDNQAWKAGGAMFFIFCNCLKDNLFNLDPSHCGTTQGKGYLSDSLSRTMSSSR